ncbi:MAG: hypothetical protein V7675_08235 [Hyphomonas sp.]
MPNYTLEQLRKDGLPYLVAYLMAAAEQRATLTYGQIAERLERDLKIDGRIFSTQIGHPVGALMEHIHASFPDAPLINALVVNRATGFASEGVDVFLSEHFSVPLEKIQKQPSVKQELLRKALADVYGFKGWKKIADELFGADHHVFAHIRVEPGTEVDKSTSPGQPRGGDAESPEHRALKERIAAHPDLVGAPENWLAAEVEFLLKSGDEVDVCITSATETRLVEVKSRRSNEVDFERGIYQCVKYRAVYEAMCAAEGSQKPVSTILATETKLPSRLLDLAGTLDVITLVVAP